MSILLIAAEHVEAIPPTWRVVTKFLYFLALAAAIGGTWTYLTVVAPALRRSERLSDADHALLRRRALRLAAIGTTSLLAVAYFQLAARVAQAGDGMAYSSALAPHAIAEYLTAPAKKGNQVAVGQLVTVQNILIVVAALVMLPALFGRLSRRSDVLCAAAGGLVVAASLVVSIPTKSPDLDVIAQKVLIQTHIVGGSLWIGGLAMLAALALARRHLDESAGQAWAVMWGRFGALALVSVGGVLLSGIWLTYREVGSFEQFVTTPFGRFLLLKIALVAALMAAGAYNELVLMPKIARAGHGGDGRGVFLYVLVAFPRVVMTEVVLGLGVLLIVPFLSGSARSQAAGKQIEGPAFDGRLLMLGLLLLATIAASFYATAQASAALGRRPLAAPEDEEVGSIA